MFPLVDNVPSVSDPVTVRKPLVENVVPVNSRALVASMYVCCETAPSILRLFASVIGVVAENEPDLPSVSVPEPMAFEFVIVSVTPNKLALFPMRVPPV